MTQEQTEDFGFKNAVEIAKTIDPKGCYQRAVNEDGSLSNYYGLRDLHNCRWVFVKPKDEKDLPNTGFVLTLSVYNSITAGDSNGIECPAILIQMKSKHFKSILVTNNY